MLSFLSPSPTNSSAARTSPPISPQTDTGFPAERKASMTRFNVRNMAGERG